MFWQRQQTKFLKEFGAHLKLYQRVYVISYLPPSQAFGIREELNNRAPIEKPLVLLEIEMPASCKLYRWQRAGVVEAIERANLEQQWQPIFQQIDRDMRRELDRRLINWRI